MTEEVLAPTGEALADAVQPLVCPKWAARRIVPARLVAELGRAGLVWFALAVVHAGRHPLTDRALLAVTVAASIFVVTLKAASSPAIILFGRGLARALGVGLGLGALAILNGTSFGLHVGWAWLAAAAVGVWATTSIWDRCVDQLLAARKRVLLVGADGADVLLPEDIRRCMHSGFEILGASGTAENGDASVTPVGMDELERRRPDPATRHRRPRGREDVRRRARVGCSTPERESAWRPCLASASACSVECPSRRSDPAWFMCLVDLRQHVYSRPSKRVFDILAAVVGLVLAAPLIAVMALLTKTTPGPVLFRQTRVGEGGQMLHRPEDPDDAMRRRGGRRHVHL